MDQTANLALPYILAGQAQKHVPHNEALRVLDALVQAAVVDRDLTGPPSSPADGARYLVAAPATGAWAGRDGEIAAFVDGAWVFLAPREGWTVWVCDENEVYVHDGGGWVVRPAGVPSVDPVARVGVNTTADATNRLAVKSDAVLLSHDDVTPGTGDLRAMLNKATTAKDAGLVFETGFSARAVLGLLGSDDTTLEVSADGTTFRRALTADRTTGRVGFPCGLVDPASGQSPALLVPAVVKDIWRSDVATAAGTPRSYTVASVAGATVTLTTAAVGEFFSPAMRNCTMVRVWNVTKSPAESAWVTWDVSTTSFTVSDAAHVASWAAGESLRLGDPNPTGANTLSMVALDLSNYLYNSYGRVWRQRGLKFSNSVVGTGGAASLEASGSGAANTVFGSGSNSDGSRQATMVDVFTGVQSPISNSNLLFVRESLITGTSLGVSRLMRLVGLWV